MSMAINNALSGLYAAGRRLEVASANLANTGTTRTVEDGVAVTKPYQPKEAVQIAQDGGGVAVEVRADNSVPQKIFSPEHPDADEQGFVALPGISQEEQMVNAKIASYDYRANLKSIAAQDKLFENLLDILS